MSNDLHKTLETLASQFAHDVLAAMRGASLEDILAESRHAAGARAAAPRAGRARRAAAAAGGKAEASGRGRRKKGRLSRRSPGQIAKVQDAIVALLKKSPKGLRAEQIKDALSLDRRELPRPLAEGLKKKTLRKKGEKRATTYFAA